MIGTAGWDPASQTYLQNGLHGNWESNLFVSSVDPETEMMLVLGENSTFQSRHLIIVGNLVEFTRVHSI